MISVAIDGPAGAGKSTIAKRAAAALSYIYVDTGALYRTVALSLLEGEIDLSDPAAVEAALPEVQVDIRYAGGEQRMLLSGKDVSDRIRTPEVSMAASTVSAQPAVRAFLLEMQRALARSHNVIMDGRDIGTVVLPGAAVKIFLTASPEERAGRRYKELVEKGEQVTFAKVLADLERRDYQDSHRAVAPLRPADDAVTVDTTGLSLEQSVEAVLSVVRKKLDERGRAE